MANAAVSQAPFAHVLSFGSCCLVARILREAGVRLYAGPFDWLFSSAQMVRHCIGDDFSTFLDVDQILGQPPEKARCHSFYGEMMNRVVVFPHHEPRGRDRGYYKRSVQRFLNVLASPEKKLFVLVHLVQSQQELHGTRDPDALGSVRDGSGSSNAEIGRLFDELNMRGVVNFELRVVHAVEPGLDQRIEADRNGSNSHSLVFDTGPGRERLVVYELHCAGRFTGLFFKNFVDEKSMKQLMLGNPFEKRNFKLQPDPLALDSVDSKQKPWQTTSMEILPVTKGKCLKRNIPRKTIPETSNGYVETRSQSSVFREWMPKPSICLQVSSAEQRSSKAVMEDEDAQIANILETNRRIDALLNRWKRSPSSPAVHQQSEMEVPSKEELVDYTSD
eukprot:gnl/MRDRNA2_/MRDRNA2_135635_c0_seq1.p1 gnl/MRDRNA2_/MRDRNA2_135635_c0~~gnl/MRDRNA2_/MRDRNA2_135635_c0_seq1.p1  ORF type:complete len:390 (-),score=64.47 gnl/MRDRNA2_/MRDRNA2_135635_c0_seq1:13-1182(-)